MNCPKMRDEAKLVDSLGDYGESCRLKNNNLKKQKIKEKYLLQRQSDVGDQIAGCQEILQPPRDFAVVVVSQSPHDVGSEKMRMCLRLNF